MASDLLCDKCCRFLGRVYVADIGEAFCRECLAEARREGFREGWNEAKARGHIELAHVYPITIHAAQRALAALPLPEKASEAGKA